MSQFMRLLRRDEGVEAVEFALVVPVLLMLISGIVNLGSAFNAATLVSTAVRDGARVGSIGGSVNDICVAVKTATSSLSNYATETLTVKYDTVTVTPSISTCSSTLSPTSGDTLTVTVAYANKWLIPIVFSNSTVITKSNQMRVE